MYFPRTPMATAKHKKTKKTGVDNPPKFGESIPKGHAFLPDVSDEELDRIHADMSGRRNVPKEALILSAIRKRRKGLNITEIAKHLDRPRSTVNGWLIRVRDRGLEGLSDRNAPNRKPKLDDKARKILRIWLAHNPQTYGFESDLWQLSMLSKMLIDRLGLDIRPRTLRHTLRVMKYAYRKPREIPYRSATTEEQEQFKKDTQERMDALAKEGYTIFYEDEMSVKLAAQASRGWMLRGGNETVKTSFSKKSVKVVGALGQDKLHVMPCDSTNSNTFKIFIEALYQKYGKLVFVVDNASYHKSHTIQEYLKSKGGEVILIYLPPYTPQLNPIEIQWRMIKIRLAGRYFATEEDLKDAIIRLVESGEVQPVQISSLPIA